MRRRAIVGTAVVAGGAIHHANAKNAQEQAAADEQAQLEQAQQQALDAQAAQRQSAAGPSAGLGTAQMDELTKLAGLHDQGILSDEEFAAQKAKILG